MDSITQILLGASVAAVVVPAHHRRAALLAGAALGTLPDLDSLPIALFTDDPVALMTLHRGFSHSLFVLPLVAWAIWAFFRSRGKRVAEAPMRWFWAIQLALVTHPLLDAFTVYGTQLLWPLQPHPAMWSSVFIIDPLYTLWLLIGMGVAAFAGPRRIARPMLVAGLALSTVYLGWSLVAKGMVEREAERSLAALGLQDTPRFSVPMPFNTLLWRVVAITPEGYVIGDRSVVADRGPMHFERHASDVEALAAVSGIHAVQRLQWFNRGFMRAEVRDGELVLSDLRMGLEPEYAFNFVVARADGDGGWRSIPPRQLESAYRAPVEEGGVMSALAGMWARIWTQPVAPAQ
ncbi:metal-dependent hydrolase [Luteimonas aestuarii]|uniref:Metal-dependent hydrolase n=1 Tax=Luteimonas aestuarii TaxID=453837 RepID=A0A4R5U1B9_9GAMM|nr:metal-dependent hydrolase [Luteimonas aestuarii]TDK27367.1 metal-dependent hydrolase [Luteimonas aestuarii]